MSTATSAAIQNRGHKTRKRRQAAGKCAVETRVCGGDGGCSGSLPRYGTRSQTLIRKLDFHTLRKAEEALLSVCLPVPPPPPPPVQYSDFIIDLVEGDEDE